MFFVVVKVTVDVDVKITAFSGQTFSFDTGLGVEGAYDSTTVEIYVYDVCRYALWYSLLYDVLYFRW